MRVLVVGKGGREHALAKALCESASVEKVFAIPGSHGMEPDVVACGGSELFSDVMAAYKSHVIDLVVVGPEAPLVHGLSDQLRSQGVLVFGPDQRGARLEGSKIFAKDFMTKYQIPTAAYEIVSSVTAVEQVVDQFTPPYVLKADGLAAGKGVFICQTRAELMEAAHDIFQQKTLGMAGEQAVLEQFQPGYELSFFMLTNGEGFVALPMAQDHKRLGDHDKGPNTGGMGAVAPIKMAKSVEQDIIEQVVSPTLVGLKQEGFTYRGVVFIGIMMTEAGPQVLEYNIRFGDPETQVLLPLLDGDWGEVFSKIAKGELAPLAWKDIYTACVVLAAENYPTSPVKGIEVRGDFSQNSQQYFLHAGTKKQGGAWFVNGGRVLNAVGLGSSLQEAMNYAYNQAHKVQWPNYQMRQDIGQKALARKGELPNEVILY